MVKIKYGDSFDLLSSLESQSIDLICTDPPYGIRYKDWDVFNFIDFTESWVKECFRVLKPSGTLWSFMGYANVFEFVPILQLYGNVHLENWVIWARQKGRGSSNHLKSMREDIFHVTKTDEYIWNNLKMLREVVVPYVKDGKPRGWFLNNEGKRVRWTGLGNVWVYTSPFWNSKTDPSYGHPSQKPLLLMERLLLLSSNEGDVVLDPFMGSGTTGVAALKNNRKFIGFENNKEYFDIAYHRLNN